MARPDTVLKSIKTAIKQSGRLPNSTSYATFELDSTGAQSNVRPPIVEITNTSTIRSRPHNTDFSGFATDNAGNHIGRIYDALFEMEIQIDVWTAAGDDYDQKEIGGAVRRALYQYDSVQVDDKLPDPSDPDTTLGDIDYFTVDEGSPANDLSMTPALRRWRQSGEVWFRERVNTAEEYGADDFIASVKTPADGDSAQGTDVAITLKPP